MKAPNKTRDEVAARWWCWLLLAAAGCWLLAVYIRTRRQPTYLPTYLPVCTTSAQYSTQRNNIYTHIHILLRLRSAEPSRRIQRFPRVRDAASRCTHHITYVQGQQPTNNNTRHPLLACSLASPSVRTYLRTYTVHIIIIYANTYTPAPVCVCVCASSYPAGGLAVRPRAVVVVAVVVRLAEEGRSGGCIVLIRFFFAFRIYRYTFLSRALASTNLTNGRPPRSSPSSSTTTTPLPCSISICLSVYLSPPPANNNTYIIQCLS